MRTRSPFFYVGDKYKIIDQLIKVMPEKIGTYIEPFVGGGSSFLNVEALKYQVNDIDRNIVELHRNIKNYSNKENKLYEDLYYLIDKYNLTCSFLGKTVTEEMKKKYKKTYFAKQNKESYLKLREDFNFQEKKDMNKLYLLLIYGFNHMLRFNKNGKFNLPVGNVDYNKNVNNSLKYYLNFMRNKQVKFTSQDYKKFINKLTIDSKRDYIYLDPPYLISSSEYNKLWSEDQEKELYNLLDELNQRGIKFGISNLVNHKGKENSILKKWMENYIVYEVNSNYISRFDNTIKEDSREVFVTNYEKRNS